MLRLRRLRDFLGLVAQESCFRQAVVEFVRRTWFFLTENPITNRRRVRLLVHEYFQIQGVK
jgi:hypothetical protein